MHTNEALALLATAGQLALGAFAFRRADHSPVARPLAMLCFVLAAWNVVNWAYQASLLWAWRTLDISVSPWIVPLALHVVLAFVGRRRELRKLLIATYAYYGLLSLSSVGGGFYLWARTWIESPEWTLCYLIPFVLVISLCVVLLGQHVRRSSNEHERMRARLMLVGIAIGGALGFTELLDEFIALPALGMIGSLVTTGVFAVVALRMRLFGRELSASTPLYAAGIGVMGLMAFLVVFHTLDESITFTVLGSLTVTGLLLAAMIPVISRAVTRREHTRRLAGMGRFAEQMAHDIKNPLAALKGSVQFLAEERERGRSIDEQTEFLQLMSEQVDRVQKTVDRYQRLASCDPRVRSLRVNDVVKRVLALQPHAQASGIALETDLSPDDPGCVADPDLLANAVENLVRNAVEAMPKGGTLTVRTLSGPNPGSVSIVVEDQGVGLDARQREEVFDEFFTTKPNGSGLGLTFVRRVADAHGGEVDLTSSVGVGTRVRLTMPQGAGGDHREA